MATAHLLRSILQSAFAPALIFLLVAGAVRLFRLNRYRVPWAALSAVITGIVAMIGTAYLFLPVLLEDAETDIACVSALAMRGLPVYPAMDAAQRYILLYGPLTYLAHIPFYLLFGETLFAFKLLGCGALLLSLFGLYRICREYATPRASLIGLGCAALVFFRYIGVEFWGRIDPLIIVLIVVSIWATGKGPLWAAILVDGFVFAAVPDLKISGFAYLLPVFALLLFRRGWRPAAAAAALGAILFPLPFLLPMVSLSNYVTILKAAAGHGLVLNFLIRNVQYSALLLLPVLAALSVRKTREAAQLIYLASIVTGLLMTCVLGSKSGAGSYHLLPYIAPLLHLYFWTRSEMAPGDADRAFAQFAIAWAVTTLFLSSTHLQSVIHEYRAAPLGWKAVADVQRAEDLYRGRTIEVGVGADFEDPRTRYGYLTTFAGQPYTVSGAAIRDLQAGGIPIPEATVKYVESCGAAVWLIPKGDAPFTALNSYYETPHPAFEPQFRKAFTSHYRRAASGEQFDAWVCKQ